MVIHPVWTHCSVTSNKQILYFLITSVLWFFHNATIPKWFHFLLFLFWCYNSSGASFVLSAESSFCSECSPVKGRFKLIQSHRWCHFSLTIGGNVYFLHDETWNLKGRCRRAATQLKLESWSQMSVSRCGCRAPFCTTHPIPTPPTGPEGGYV